MTSAAANCAISAIGVYQRHLSPRKGFRCAHHACTGGPSCSGYARRAFLEMEFFAALTATWQRLIQCSEYATDPFKGKISEDDPGPLKGADLKHCMQAVGCAGCLFFDPLYFLGS